MFLSKPVWKQEYGGLLVRLPLGAFFILQGIKKVEDLEAFIKIVQGYGILPDQLATLYGVLLPYVEIGAGVLLVVGLWTVLAAAVSSLMLLSFILAVGLFPISSNPNLFNKDVLLLGASLSLLATGAGAFSIDQFRRGS